MSGIADDTALSALERAVERHPGAPLLRIDGTVVTYEEAIGQVTAVAGGLTANGVGAGDRVAIMSGNCRQAAWSWLGTGAAGAIDVPLNTSARGSFLEEQLANCSPTVIIGSAEYLDRLADSVSVDPALVVSLDGEYDRDRFAPSVRHQTFEELKAAGATAGARTRRPLGSETGTILYTSGTTGPSKGVMLPQRYWPVWGRRGAELLEIQPGEVFYCTQPLFHIDARVHLQSAIAAGGTAALGLRFSASGFWDELREHRASIFSYVGTMLWLLYKQPESDRDRDHGVRIAPGSSTPPEIHEAFEQRFGVSLREGYGMTENGYLLHAVASSPPGTLGEVVPEMELALFDDDDVPVPPDHPGEACFRPREPFVSVQGYWGRTAESLAAMRNQWFHSGDLLTRDTDGHYRYVGRKKDAIRRRGENVSAWEIETAAATHPDILETAAIGVPSPIGEEDIALLVTVKAGSGLSPAAVREHVAPNLPDFAVPRYVEFVESFPKTPSERIDKAKVREAGISDAAWDAEG